MPVSLLMQMLSILTRPNSENCILHSFGTSLAGFVFRHVARHVLIQAVVPAADTMMKTNLPGRQDCHRTRLAFAGVRCKCQ